MRYCFNYSGARFCRLKIKIALLWSVIVPLGVLRICIFSLLILFTESLSVQYCLSPVQHPRFQPLPFVFLRVATQSVRFVLPSAFFFYENVFLIAIFLLISVQQTSICHREKLCEGAIFDPCTAIRVSTKLSYAAIRNIPNFLVDSVLIFNNAEGEVHIIILSGIIQKYYLARVVRVRHSLRLACLRSHVLRAYCNFEL